MGDREAEIIAEVAKHFQIIVDLCREAKALGLKPEDMDVHVAPVLTQLEALNNEW